jgi:uncharacterized protein YfeS
MKTGAIIAVFTFLLACSDSPKRDPMPLSNQTDSVIHPMLKIGGCYVYEFKEDSLPGVILIEIFRELGVDYYTFLLSGHFFKGLPSANEFIEAGIWGRKIPKGANYKVDYDLGFYTVTMSRENIEVSSHKLRLAHTLSVSKNINHANSGVINSFTEIVKEFELIGVLNNRKNLEADILPAYPIEVYPISEIPLAKNKAEEAVPVSVWRISPETVHPIASQLMKEEWFWREADDLSPFGNDDGHDALYLFKEWRERHPGAESAIFLKELETAWQMSFAHMDIESEKTLPQIEKANQFYRNIDRAIIGVCFAQLVLEGTISPRLKGLGLKAINRTNTTYTMNGMMEGDKKEYEIRLRKMESVLNQL